jgi:hypothetical protein
VDKPAQERASGDNNRPRLHLPAIGQHQATDTVPIRLQIMRFRFNHGEARLALDRPLHSAAIERPVGLRPRSVHGLSLAAIEDAKLDAGPVGDTGHQPVHGVDLPDQMALAETADRRIARHLADRRKAVGNQRRPRAGARRRGRRLAAGMATTNNNHVID